MRFSYGFRLLVVYAALALGCGVATAKDIYIAQNAAGAGDGTSCVNARALSFFNTASNWGAGTTQIGPGTTVRLCGTISTQLTTQASGSMGAPITIYFEPGARISLPYCDASNGCLSIANRSNVIVDGGTICGWINGGSVPCNGAIEATANGSSLANRHDIVGVVADHCDNCEIRGIHFANLYQHTSTSDETNGTFRAIQNLSGNTPGTTYLVHHNQIDNAASAIVYVPNGPGQNALQVYNNDITRINSSVDISNNNNGTLTGATIHDNHFGSTATWDSAGCFAHHNSLHAFAYTTSNSNIDYYNNLIDGDWGNCPTSGLFIEGSGSLNYNVRVFNNVFLMTYTQENNGVVSITAGGDILFVNNTIVGAASSDTCLSIQNVPTQGVVTVKNNIVTNCGTTVLTFSDAIRSANSFDYNLYGTVPNGSWTNQSIPAWYSSLAAWQAGSHCDATSSAGLAATYPQLAASAKPSTGSPTIAAGVNLTSLGVPALTFDRTGAPRPSTGAWDIGAYNSGATVPPPPTPPSAPTTLSLIVH